ncbi:hypothetical protein GA0074695_2612 [Micromonospora viridifaciens]|uniref:Hemophore-related protein, Rv0203/Rv1174c family n=1 Tax=Micromonospora viridifaciens TaxID=1881 RepID=A0A1C4WNB8_MICVI|nr:hypothetical protein [Micromonospora viridifaciens]SCE97659.1 hypothetical protein GA0074695_2612 [Micromonospora viridifaciens]
MRISIARIALTAAVTATAVAGLAGPARAADAAASVTSPYCADLKAQYTSDYNMFLKYRMLQLNSKDPALRTYYGSLASRYFTMYQQGLAVYQATC